MPLNSRRVLNTTLTRTSMMERSAAEARWDETCEGVDRPWQTAMGRNQSAVITNRRAILALLPFLVKGALSLSVLRAMRDRGFQLTIAYYMYEAAGLTRDPAEDFASKGLLVNMTDAVGVDGVNRLERLIRQRGISLLLQIGAPQAYRQLPYVKERLPNLHILDTLYNPIGHTVNHFLFERAFDGVIVESMAMRTYVLANTAKNSPCVYLVESGIALDDFVPSIRQRNLPDPLTLGYLGRMSPEKNPLGFVEIAERLHAAIPTLRFRLFGQGAMEREVRARVAASPAAAAITFDGYLPHAREALRAIDVLV